MVGESAETILELFFKAFCFQKISKDVSLGSFGGRNRNLKKKYFWVRTFKQKDR